MELCFDVGPTVTERKTRTQSLHLKESMCKAATGQTALVRSNSWEEKKHPKTLVADTEIVVPLPSIEISSRPPKGFTPNSTHASCDVSSAL